MERVKIYEEFEEAELGCTYNLHMPTRVCYSIPKCVNILVDRDGMSEEEAYEHLEFNYFNAYIGEDSPIFIGEYEV